MSDDPPVTTTGVMRLELEAIAPVKIEVEVIGEGNGDVFIVLEGDADIAIRVPRYVGAELGDRRQALVDVNYSPPRFVQWVNRIP